MFTRGGLHAYPSSLRSHAGALLLTAGGLAPVGAPAQSGFYVTPSVSAVQVYDDNLFASASQPEKDFITRITPSLDSGYRSEQLHLEGGVEFDAETYAEHEEFDSIQARRHAGLDFRYAASRRLTLAAEGSYTRTNRPEELSIDPAVDTGLELGRARAERFAIAPAAEYRFDPRTAGSADYSFTRDELSGGITSETHTAALGLEREITRRDTGSIGYTFRRFLFEGDDDTDAHVVDFGWTRELTPRTSLSLRGGPRFSQGSVDPEVSASIRHRLERGTLGFTYSRSQGTVIGEADAVETETFAASVSYSLTRSLEVSAAPSLLTITRGAFEADVYRLDLDARYELNRYVSFVGAWRFSLQQGSLDGTDEDIERNVVWVGIVLSYPPRRPSALPAGARSRGTVVAASRRTVH